MISASRTRHTIVIYSTDNGADDFDGRMRHDPSEVKRTPTGKAVIACRPSFRWPGVVKPGIRSTMESCSSEDWFPTLLSTAGPAGVKEKLLRRLPSRAARRFRVHLDGYDQKRAPLPARGRALVRTSSTSTTRAIWSPCGSTGGSSFSRNSARMAWTSGKSPSCPYGLPKLFDLQGGPLSSGRTRKHRLCALAGGAPVLTRTCPGLCWAVPRHLPGVPAAAEASDRQPDASAGEKASSLLAIGSAGRAVGWPGTIDRCGPSFSTAWRRPSPTNSASAA